MPSLPHHLPQPRRNQSPGKRPQRIHHQIRQFEKAHAQEQLEALDAEGEAEAGQGRKPEPTPGAEPLGRCKELREEEAERGEYTDVGKQFGPSGNAGMDNPVKAKINSGVVRVIATKPHQDRRLQQKQPHKNRHPQSHRGIRRALFPNQ